jgi:hypothetical protein
LQRELEVEPDASLRALYQDIRGGPPRIGIVLNAQQSSGSGGGTVLTAGMAVGAGDSY